MVFSDSNKFRIQKFLVYKRTLKHLAKLAKWLSCVVTAYLYGAFDHVTYALFRVNLPSIVK